MENRQDLDSDHTFVPSEEYIYHRDPVRELSDERPVTGGASDLATGYSGQAVLLSTGI